MDDIFINDEPEPESIKCQKQQRKKEKQWKKWTEEVIPSMLRPHLYLLCKSESLHSIPQPTKPQCSCHGSSHKLKVVCVYFERECPSSFSHIRNSHQNLKLDCVSLQLDLDLLDCASEANLFPLLDYASQGAVIYCH
jgi:hypothetical protein